jgi:hypothetical protein
MRYNLFWEKHNKKSEQTAIKELTSLGYKEIPTCNGGDDDRIIIDHIRREWAFWEYGFSPFATNEENYPNDFSLEYWYDNAR